MKKTYTEPVFEKLERNNNMFFVASGSTTFGVGLGIMTSTKGSW